MEKQIIDTMLVGSTEHQDSIIIGTQEIVDTVSVYIDKVSILETFITIESIILAGVIMVAAHFWTKVRNYKKNGVEL